MVGWRLEAAARNHRGILRATNEDNFYLNGRWLSPEAMTHGGRYLSESEAHFQLYAVCDGLGGEASGEKASYEAVSALGALQSANLNGLSEAELKAALYRLTDQIRLLGENDAERAGTTLTACLWQGGWIRVLNLGDSRVYRLRDGRLSRLTVDHSEVQRMVALGLMTPYQARLSPRRHLIYRYLGLSSADTEFEPYLSERIAAQTGDCYLLCSDGLIDMVEEETIRRLLLRARSAAQAVDALVQRALDNGGHDNVTALCIWVAGPGRISLKARMAALKCRLSGRRD